MLTFYFIIQDTDEEFNKIYRITGVNSKDEAIEKFVDKYFPLISFLNITKYDLEEIFDCLSCKISITTDLYD